MPTHPDPHAFVERLVTALILALLWFGLSGGEYWGFALAAIGASLLASSWLIPPRRHVVSPLGLAQFALYFGYRSVMGGVDVASRALHLRVPLDIREHSYRFALPDGPGRTVVVGALSLMPGTLSVALDGDRLEVHSIAGDARAELERLERRAGSIFRQEVASE